MYWHKSRKASHNTAHGRKRKYNPQTRTHTKEKIIKYVRLDRIHSIKTVKLKDDRLFLPENIDSSITFYLLMRRLRGAWPIKITGTNKRIHKYSTTAQHDERSNNGEALFIVDSAP
jgi:hypothetical protein